MIKFEKTDLLFFSQSLINLLKNVRPYVQNFKEKVETVKSYQNTLKIQLQMNFDHCKCFNLNLKFS